MDFSREESVKIYRTDSATARVWGFFGSVLMHEIVRRADRAGVIYLPELSDLFVSVAAALDCPDVKFIADNLPKLLMHGAVRHQDDALIVEKYHEAQYTVQATTVSSAVSKRKRKDVQKAIDKGLINPPFWWKAICYSTGT
jgi:hypothetical protein